MIRTGPVTGSCKYGNETSGTFLTNRVTDQ